MADHVLGLSARRIARYGLVRSISGFPDAAIGGAAAGAVIGAAQWLVLRQQIPVSPLGSCPPRLALAPALPSASAQWRGDGRQTLLVRALIAGMLIGALQWLVLRQFVAAAVWWFGGRSVLGSWVGGDRAAGVDLSRGWAVFGSTARWLRGAHGRRHDVAAPASDTMSDRL